jgi:triphosphoribosyl-dephospho-CoA synthetase
MNEPDPGERARNVTRLSAGRLAQVACLLEVTAQKPGNVHRSWGNQLNPGTTADLVTAALFAALRDGTIQLPRPAGSASWSVA